MFKNDIKEVKNKINCINTNKRKKQANKPFFNLMKYTCILVRFGNFC